MGILLWGKLNWTTCSSSATRCDKIWIAYRPKWHAWEQGKIVYWKYLKIANDTQTYLSKYLSVSSLKKKQQQKTLLIQIFLVYRIHYWIGYKDSLILVYSFCPSTMVFGLHRVSPCPRRTRNSKSMSTVHFDSKTPIDVRCTQIITPNIACKFV